MKYLLLSDIHGSLPALDKALAFGRAQQCDMILLMGDILNYGPRNSVPQGLDARGIADRLNALADRIVAVRGNCDSEVDQMLLDFPIMSDYAVVVDEGRRMFLTHGHVYNEQHMPPCRHDMFFYGHTHVWKLCRHDGAIVCNTGSVTFPKEGRQPTFVICDGGVVTVRDMQGEVVETLK